jgi:hypothetical protein
LFIFTPSSELRVSTHHEQNWGTPPDPRRKEFRTFFFGLSRLFIHAALKAAQVRNFADVLGVVTYGKRENRCYRHLSKVR